MRSTIAAVVLALLVSAGAHAGPPNLVVILTDDLGVGALDALLDAGLMPNLDEHLVRRGVRFENAFVTTPICCPSRATFFTGLYAHRHQVYSNIYLGAKGGIAWPAWFGTDTAPGREGEGVATWLSAGGYHTGFVGKYLNGYGRLAPGSVSDPATYVPPGWDDWQALVGDGTYKVYNFTVNDNGTHATYGDAEADYQTDVLARRAAQYVEERADSEQPFFLSINTLAPHVEVPEAAVGGAFDEPRRGFAVGIRPARRHLHLIDGDPGNGEIPALPSKPSFNETDMSDKPHCDESPPRPAQDRVLDTEPTCVGNIEALREDIDVPNVRAQYKSMLASMLAVDDLIGTVQQALETNGFDGNTVVMFTSDNGWFYGEHRRHGKDVVYEEAIRVPLIVRGPGFAADASARQVALNNDIAPTLAALAGVTPPYVPDGASLVPVLEDPARGDWPRKTFLVEYWFFPTIFPFHVATYSALRTLDAGRDYVYVQTRADPDDSAHITHREFYNLRNDRYQLQSVDLPDATDRALDRYLLHFRGCKGAQCRLLESY